MAGEALFVGWGAPTRGREKQALQVFQESIEYWGRLQQEGRIERFDVVQLSPHGGDLSGFALLYGSHPALAEIRFSEEFERILVRAQAIVERAGVVPAYTGEALGRQVALYQAAADEFGG